jgi:hypothetical protein
MQNIVLRSRAINLNNSDVQIPLIKHLLVKVLKGLKRIIKLSLTYLKIAKPANTFLLNVIFKKNRINSALSLTDAEINSEYEDTDAAYQSVLFLLSCASVEKHCLSPNRTFLKTHDTNSFQTLFKRNYEYIRETYHRNQPANLLYIGGDVIAVNDFEFPSTKIQNFQMFNYANFPEKFHISRAGDREFEGGQAYFEHYLNAEVRLYGHNMSENIWKIGDSWFDNWINYWEYDQDLWNAMFRAELHKNSLTTLTDEFIPNTAFGYQLPINETQDQLRITNWNRIPISSAKLVHLHSSRGVKNTVKFVQEKLLNSQHLHL